MPITPLSRAYHTMARIAFPPGKLPGGKDQWARTVLNGVVEERLSRLPVPELTAIEVSGEAHAARGWASYRKISFPEYDICDPAISVDPADVVIAEQVLEHVPRPWDAVSNLARLCVPGGVIIVTTPFLLRRHEEPNDYWRFTEDGLRTLFTMNGVEVEAAGAWGNRLCVVGNFETWPRRRSWHPLHNERDFPVVVWAFGTPARVA